MPSSISGSVTPNHYHTGNFGVFIGSPFEELNQYVLSATSSQFDITIRELYHNNNPVKYPGNVNRKTSLNIEFILDEYLRSFKLLWDWFEILKDTNSPEAHPLDMSRADIKISMYDSTKTKTVGEFVFGNAWPTTIPSIVFTYENRSSRAEALSIAFESDYLDFNQDIPYYETESRYAPN